MGGPRFFGNHLGANELGVLDSQPCVTVMSLILLLLVRGVSSAPPCSASPLSHPQRCFQLTPSKGPAWDLTTQERD